VKFILQMSDLGQPVRIKYIPSLAFVATCVRPLIDRPLKPLGKNWSKGFEKRYLQTVARRIMAIDWNCYDRNISEKMIHWFKVIGQVLRDPTV
jgi:hypothetical protein